MTQINAPRSNTPDWSLASPVYQRAMDIGRKERLRGGRDPVRRELQVSDNENVATILKSTRIRLREYTHADIEELAAILGNEETMRFYSRPKTRDECVGWIDWNLKLYAEHGFGLWVMESRQSGAFLGDCGLTPQLVEGVADIEIGWHTKKEFWNQGFATEAAFACRDLGFNDFGLKHLISIIDPGNIASRRVAEKIGMRPERTAIHNQLPCVIYTIERSESLIRPRWAGTSTTPTASTTTSPG